MQQLGHTGAYRAKSDDSDCLGRHAERRCVLGVSILYAFGYRPRNREAFNDYGILQLKNS